MTARHWVLSKLTGRSLKYHPPFKEQVGTVYDLQGFPDIMVSDEQRQAVFITELLDNFLDIKDCDGIDAAERFVEHEETGIGAECPCDGEASLLTAGESKGGRATQTVDAEALK